ncbi:hypothetical protein [Sphingobacterium siyangense]|uniref:Uncharacterized protein n=1 Tax=Sphingobacterium siyangense TaxID=459529 RepID=A0A562MQT4_9SPHI|nr:hypothetical protein [Sphingobacterium siyangense]TWI22210.1 hypothetical protein IQ31_01615 [Sphingobacterium siyangense]
MKQPISKLKEWFGAFKMPTANQFGDWIDSYWHKDTKIPASQVEGWTDDSAVILEPGVMELPDLSFQTKNKTARVLGGTAGKTFTYKGAQYPINPNYEGILFWTGATKVWGIQDQVPMSKGADGGTLSKLWDANKVDGYLINEVIRNSENFEYLSTKNLNTSLLTNLTDWIDVKSNESFIFTDTKYQRSSSNWGILDLEIWDEAVDLNKDYYIRGLGIRTTDNVLYFNIYSTEMSSGNLYGIAPSGNGNITGGDYTGIKTFSIYKSGNSNVAIGSVTFDFSKIRTSGNYNNTSMYGILKKSIFKKYKDNAQKAGVDIFPFSNKNINFNRQLYKSLKNIVIFDADVDLGVDYYLLNYNLNNFNSTQNAYLIYFAIARIDSGGGSNFLYTIAPSASTLAYISTPTIQSGVQRLPIYKKGFANIEIGYIDVDFSVHENVSYSTVGTTTGALLSPRIFIPTRLYKPVTATSHRLILPNNIYFLDDAKLPIFKQSVFSSSFDLDRVNLYYGRIDGDYPMMNHVPHSALISPSELGSSLRISAKYSENKSINNVAYYKDLTVHKVNSSDLVGKTATVIGAGDSITDFNMMGNVNRKLTAKGINLNYQGTMTDIISGVTTRNEGRSSWEYRQAIGKTTKRFNEAKAILPQPIGSDSDINQNPFIYPATPAQISNNPTWCFENHVSSGGLDNEKNYTQSQLDGGYSGDYYTFDFERYVSGHNIIVGDKLIFISNWGFNDVNHLQTTQGVEDALLGIEIVVNRLKQYATANPTKQVVVGISGLLVVNVNLIWNTLFSNYLERAIVLVKSLKTTLESLNFKLDFVPVIMSVDRSFAWNYPANASTTISVQNDTKYSTPADVVHPHDVGINQISNMLMNYIANKL